MSYRAVPKRIQVLDCTTRSYGWTVEKPEKQGDPGGYNNIGHIETPAGRKVVYHAPRVHTKRGVEEMWFLVNAYKDGKAEFARTKPEGIVDIRTKS